MNTDQKIVIFAIAAMLASVLSIVVYNTYDSSIRVEAYKECTDVNKKIAEMITRQNSESLRISSIPTCSMR